MIAFAFTGPGATRPFVGGRWPEPGMWADGARGSVIRHLPVWIAAELWLIELDGAVHEVETQLRAERGRLVRRITAWDADAALAFAEACADRVVELVDAARADGAASDRMAAYGDDARALAEPAHANVAGWVAAQAAAAVEGEHGAERERGRQAAWLAERLDLESAVRV
jgi:hypothetical protein